MKFRVHFKTFARVYEQYTYKIELNTHLLIHIRCVCVCMYIVPRFARAQKIFQWYWYDKIAGFAYVISIALYMKQNEIILYYNRDGKKMNDTGCRLNINSRNLFIQQLNFIDCLLFCVIMMYQLIYEAYCYTGIFSSFFQGSFCTIHNRLLHIMAVVILIFILTCY